MPDQVAGLALVDGGRPARSLLPARLRARRAEAQLTQAAVATELGVQAQTVRAWEREPDERRAGGRPQERHWTRLADFLGLPAAADVGRLIEGRPVARPAARGESEVPSLADEAVDVVLKRLGQGSMSDVEVALANRVLNARGVPADARK